MITHMSEWVPLFQTVAWVLLIAGILFFGRASWNSVLKALEQRIEQGDDVSLGGPLGLTAELRSQTEGVPRIQADAASLAEQPSMSEPNSLAELREHMGADQRGVHLVHVVAPSEERGQKYDVFTYLYGWGRERFGQSPELRDVTHAEFFLGPKFIPSSVSEVGKQDGSRIGFVTATNAPALCLCKITFADGHQTVLSRYLDFESGDLVKTASRSN